MLGLATTTELRLACYGVLLAVICGGVLYWDHLEIAKGEARKEAQDASARDAQKAEDEKTSAGVVNDLKARLAAIPPAQPPPVLRLCVQTRSLRAQPAAPGTQPGMARAAPTIANSVPAGTPGVDIGPAVSDVERAAEIVAIYRDTTWEWALKQAK